MRGVLKTILAAVVAAAFFLGVGMSANAGGAEGTDPSGYDPARNLYYTYWWNSATDKSEKTEWQWDYDYVEVDGKYRNVTLLKNTKTEKVLKNGWYIVDEEYAYFDENGYVTYGFIGGRESKGAGWVLGYKTLYADKNTWKMDYMDRVKVQPVKYGWIKDAKGYRYGGSGYNYDGEYITWYLKGKVDYIKKEVDRDIVQIDGKKYLIEADGYLASEGWFDDGFKIDGKWESRWKYVTADGSLAEGWQDINGTYYYFDENNEMVTSQVIDGYYIGEDGTLMSEGWYNDWFWTDEKKGEWEDNWLYINADGSVTTGWAEIGGYWYYFGDGDYDYGSMSSDSVADGYYLTSDGTLATGGWYKYWYWIDSEKGEWDYDWVYTDENGYCYNGWNQIDGSWYYFVTKQDSYEGEGKTYYYWYSYMVKEQYIDGYYLGKDGVMDGSATAAWYQDDKGWYYMDTNGWYPSDTFYMIDGVSYEFDADGYMKTDSE